MFKNRDLYSSGRFYAAGVTLSIMGAILALLVAAYWLMVYAGQFEVLVLTHTGEVTFLALPWLAVLLYVLGVLIRWIAGERIVVPHAPIKLLARPAIDEIIHTLSAMGWQSVGSLWPIKSYVCQDTNADTPIWACLFFCRFKYFYTHIT